MGKFTPYGLTALPPVQDRDPNGIYFIRTAKGMEIYAIDNTTKEAVPLDLPGLLSLADIIAKDTEEGAPSGETFYDAIQYFQRGERNYFSFSEAAFLSVHSGQFVSSPSIKIIFYIPVRPGETYIVHRQEKLTNRFRVYFSKNEPDVGVSYNRQSPGGTFDNDYSTGVIEIPENYNWLTVYFRLESEPDEDVINSKIMIQRGDRESNWIPALEDLEYYLDLYDEITPTDIENATQAPGIVSGETLAGFLPANPLLRKEVHLSESQLSQGGQDELIEAPGAGKHLVIDSVVMKLDNGQLDNVEVSLKVGAYLVIGMRADIGSTWVSTFAPHPYTESEENKPFFIDEFVPSSSISGVGGLTVVTYYRIEKF